MIIKTIKKALVKKRIKQRKNVELLKPSKDFYYKIVLENKN